MPKCSPKSTGGTARPQKIMGQSWRNMRIVFIELQKLQISQYLPYNMITCIYIYTYYKMYTYIPYITLHYITLHYIILHYITLHYIRLDYIALHTYIHIHMRIYIYMCHMYVYIYMSYVYTWNCHLKFRSSKKSQPNNYNTIIHPIEDIIPMSSVPMKSTSSAPSRHDPWWRRSCASPP